MLCILCHIDMPRLNARTHKYLDTCQKCHKKIKKQLGICRCNRKCDINPETNSYYSTCINCRNSYEKYQKKLALNPKCKKCKNNTQPPFKHCMDCREKVRPEKDNHIKYIKCIKCDYNIIVYNPDNIFCNSCMLIKN
jgi:hypothetical protein